MSPCHASGFSNVPAPSAKAKRRRRNVGRAVIAAPSSSRVNGPSASASRTVSRSSGQSDGGRS